MADYNFTLEKLRFHLQKEDTLVFYGWYRGNESDGCTLRVYLDRDELRLNQHVNSDIKVRQKYMHYMADIREEVFGEIKLPHDWRQFRRFRIVCDRRPERKIISSVSTAKLKQMYGEVDYDLEVEQVVEDGVVISGWAMGSEPVQIFVTDKKGEVVPTRVERFYRKDIADIYEEVKENYKAGFKLIVHGRESNKFTLSLQSGQKESRYDYHRKLSGAALKRVFNGLSRQPQQNYHHWRKRHLVSTQELERQRREPLAYAPLFSIVIPLYRTPQHYLKEMLDSVVAQTYTNWELCLADGSGRNNSGSIGNMRSFVEHRYGLDKRVRYILLDRNKGIAENINTGLLMARGDYIIFAEHDDILPPEALYECAAALNADKSIDMIYTDEDKVDLKSQKYFEPRFKPEFNLDLLHSTNYIRHFCVIKKTLWEKAGWLHPEYDGAQDYDFIFRCVEYARHIHHIPKVLYHWRCDSAKTIETAFSRKNRLSVWEAGKRALQEHYARLDIPAKAELGTFYGTYRTVYRWKEEPLISILIPNQNQTEALLKCVQSVLDKSVYRNFEFIIIENSSTEEETFAVYKAMEEACDKVRVVYYEGEPDFSKLYNFGASHAAGEYLLLLENHAELFSPDALWEMLGYCMRGDVGVVGTQLCYPDNTIRHTGTVLAYAVHTYPQNCLAVNTSCLMTPRKIFEDVGGLAEEMQASNHIDYCQKVRALGKLVVYTPYAEFYR